MVESAKRVPAAAQIPAPVVNAAGAGALAMMRRAVTLLHFEGSGEELNSCHPAKSGRSAGRHGCPKAARGAW